MMNARSLYTQVPPSAHDVPYMDPKCPAWTWGSVHHQGACPGMDAKSHQAKAPTSTGAIPSLDTMLGARAPHARKEA